MAGIEIETGSDLASAGPCAAVDPEPRAFGGAGMAPQYREEQARLAACSPLPPGLIRTGPMEPACAGPGWGACCWAATASPSTLPPAAINTTPVTIATIRLFVQAAMAGPRLGPARPLAVTRAGPWPVTPGQAEDDEAGQDDGPAHAEQGGILDAGRAAAARGGSAAGRCARTPRDGVAVRGQLGQVEIARSSARLEIGDEGADGALDRWRARRCRLRELAGDGGGRFFSVVGCALNVASRLANVALIFWQALVLAGWACRDPGPGQHQDPGPGQHQDSGPEHTTCRPHELSHVPSLLRGQWHWCSYSTSADC